jgi:predicted permease
MQTVLNRVSGHYFEAAGIRIVAGRALNDTDNATTLKVAVINQTIANHFFPKGGALGQVLTIDSIPGKWLIVGIARDTIAGNPRETPDRMIYMPLDQMGPDESFAYTIILRTTGDPAQAIRELRAAVADVDPNLPILDVGTMQDHIETLVTHEDLISRLTAIFALLALLLAAIGLYGVMSYNVVRRTGEIGIRLALGAQGRTVLWMVLRESLLLLTLGVALGVPLALASTRLIKQQLFGLGAVDPATYAIAIGVVIAMTLIAAWLPARRAAKVDPMVALRCE